MTLSTRLTQKRSRLHRSRRELLEALESRVLLSGLVPDSLVGRETTLAITGGTGAYAQAGTSLLAVSSGSNVYYDLGVSPQVGDSFGTYSYTQTSANTAQINTADPGHGINAVTQFTYTSVDGGSYFITSAAGTQTGFFVIDPTPAGLAPVSDNGLSLNFAISQGHGNLAGAGSFVIDLSPTGSTFILTGGPGVSSGSGNAAYAATTGATAVLQTADISSGTLNYELTFTSTTGGTYLVANSLTDSWQIGYFNLSAPVAPTLTSAVALSASAVQVNWTLNSADETGENVKRWDGSTWVNIATLAPGVTTYTDTGLAPNTPYYYTVSAFNGSGEVWASAFVPAVTLNQIPPVAPTNVSATTLSTSTIRVSWSSSGNADTFTVVRWTGSAWQGIITVPAGTQSIVDAGLAPNTIYYYDVIANNGAGSTYATNFAGALTLGPPQAPANLSAAALGATSIQVTWTLHGDDGGVYVERWTGSAWAAIVLLPAGTTFYNDTGLAPNTNYFYEVVAVNANGGTWAANYASAATFPGAGPQAPTNVTATVISSSVIRVNWTLHGDDTGVYVAKWNGTAWQVVALLPAGTTVYVDNFANIGANYYEVIAANSFDVTWSATYATAVL